MALELHGIGASRGISIGKSYLLVQDQPKVNKYTLAPPLLDREIQRYQAALAAAKNQLHSILEKIPESISTDITAFIHMRLLMLEDKAFTTAPIQIIQTECCNAEWALKLQGDILANAFNEMEDAYLRDRKSDVNHIINRILHILINPENFGYDYLTRQLKDCIVLANDLTLSEVILMQQQEIAGFVTEHGGHNSHLSILARSLGIPAIVGLQGAQHYIQDNELIIIDGEQGILLAGAQDLLIQKAQERKTAYQKRLIGLNKLRNQRAITLEGTTINLEANIELPEELPLVTQAGAEGIGLYRTEFLYINRTSLPDEEEQLEAYTRVIHALNGSPVTIRTIDLGADKTVDDHAISAPISTSSLGLRAIRLCLREPSIFRPQLRAILRASAHGPVRLLLPMICTLQEVKQTIVLLKECKQELKRQGLKYDPNLPIGAMIEIPSAAICADIFAQHLDFLSIGTNDLIQYTLAIDRIDNEVNYLYTPLHPAVLQLIYHTISAGEKRNISVSMCGEMAGDVHYTRLLLALGLRTFSMHPSSLLEVKQIIAKSNQQELSKVTQQILNCHEYSEIQILLEHLNKDLITQSLIS
ncbi:phosphoenolpyruvate--protein phosphotransferase [Candidatus Nitrosacidococcus sp. I8]|uniref:phosphoenolpyruvate--protein phosphotransferase n=1 Tax=Candidatus Nitrosacidococcus sp. I8 TaxID=2942908 RepID=UPI002225CE6A|nr:phosphoenolpyruvate--protein phosphotransferase [Candidatus Nitrosacidococcus sp. I8]CAH9019607.1 Phosphoenolpyruvate-protein phosphotransferase [Candidatus Nitrosacidococcus sp. I8]